MIVAVQKAEVLDGDTDQSFLNAVAVIPLFARSVAAELREASDQVGELYPCCKSDLFPRLCRHYIVLADVYAAQALLLCLLLVSATVSACQLWLPWLSYVHCGMLFCLSACSDY